MPKQSEAFTFGRIVAVIGAVLIATGVGWLIQQNWHQMPNWAKLAILFTSTSAAFAAGVVARTKKYQGVGSALLMLGALLYTWSVFLIAQIYSTETTLQGTAWLLLLAWVGVIFSAYVFDSSGNLVIGLWQYIIWMIVQFMAFLDNLRTFASPGWVLVYLIAMAAILYGLSLLHRAWTHKFSNVYRWWTAFYVLAFAHVLALQSPLGYWWAGKEYVTGVLVMAAVLAGLGIAVFALGSFAGLRSRRVQKKEVLYAIAGILALSLIVFASSLLPGYAGSCRQLSCYDFNSKDKCTTAPGGARCEWRYDYCTEPDCYNLPNSTACEAAGCDWTGGGCQRGDCYSFTDKATCEQAPESMQCDWEPRYDACVYSEIKGPCGSRRTRIECETNEHCNWDAGQIYWNPFSKNVAPLQVWAIWIFNNIVYIALIIGVIAFGVWQGSRKLINLGIVAFAAEIIARYGGFMMDLWGYTSLAVVFITGGIVLLGGAWLLERWWRRLVIKAK